MLKTFGQLLPGDLFRFHPDPGTFSGRHLIKTLPLPRHPVSDKPCHPNHSFALVTGSGTFMEIGNYATVFHVPRVDEKEEDQKEIVESAVNKITDKIHEDRDKQLERMAERIVGRVVKDILKEKVDFQNLRHLVRSYEHSFPEKCMAPYFQSLMEKGLRDIDLLDPAKR